MENHKFIICNGDTDSIMFCKQDMSPFTKQEQNILLEEINNLLPKEIKFANDGIFKKVICLKAKNYIMVDEKGKVKIKGSSLKSATLEPALKQMLGEFINALLEDKQEILVDIYNKYVKIVRDGISDMKPWAKKMMLSPTTFNSQRKNETKVVDAIKGSEYGSGDRIWLYCTPNDELKLVEKYDGKYCIDTYLEKVFKTTKRFETILPIKELFLNFSLKRNKQKLLEL